MKYLKKYEQNTNEPKVGDYVYVHFDFVGQWGNYINNQIGKLIEININKYGSSCKAIYNITNDIYESYFKGNRDEELLNIDGDKKSIIMHFAKNEIKYFSSVIDDLEILLAVNKYNL